MIYGLNGNLKKKEKSNYCKTHLQDILLIITVSVILISLAALYSFMGTDGRWAVDPIRRKTVLGIAVILFFSVSALCWFILRKDQMKWVEERRMLLGDRPPSYDSCFSINNPINQQPPSYYTATRNYYIV